MIDFQKFKEVYLENIFSIEKIEDSYIADDYELFNNGITKSQNLAFSILSKEGINLSSDPLGDIMDMDHGIEREYNDILIRSAVKHLESVYGNERLDDSGMCLISNLIGKACQMIHNEDLLGVVRGYDKNNSRLLIIDFGDVEEVKVDVDELRIQGQKK